MTPYQMDKMLFLSDEAHTHNQPPGLSSESMHSQTEEWQAISVALLTE